MTTIMKDSVFDLFGSTDPNTRLVMDSGSSLTSRLSMTSSLTQRMNMFSPWLSFSLLHNSGNHKH